MYGKRAFVLCSQVVNCAWNGVELLFDVLKQMCPVHKKLCDQRRVFSRSLIMSEARNAEEHERGELLHLSHCYSAALASTQLLRFGTC